MTNKEAIVVMKGGDRVTHPVLKPGLWFTTTIDGNIIDNEDYPCDKFFARIVGLPEYRDGWVKIDVKKSKV